MKDEQKKLEMVVVEDPGAKTVQARSVLEAPVASVPDLGNWTTIAQALQLRPHVSDIPAPISQNILMKHEMTHQIVTRHNLPVFFMGYSVAFSGIRVYQAPQADWVIMNLADDPIIQRSGGKLIAPKGVVRDIKRLRRAGLDWEALFVAHEIPGKRLSPGEPLPIELILPPPPARVAAELDLLEHTSQAIWQGVGQGLIGIAGAAIGAAVGVGSVATIAMVAPISLAFTAASYDPVLFGLHLDRSNHIHGQPLALWYYLTHWYW